MILSRVFPRLAWRRAAAPAPEQPPQSLSETSQAEATGLGRHMRNAPAGIDPAARNDPPDAGKQVPDPAQLEPLGTALHTAATDGSSSEPGKGSSGKWAPWPQAAAGRSAELQSGARSGGLAPDTSAEHAQLASPAGYEEQAPQQPQPNAVVRVELPSDSDDESGYEKVTAPSVMTRLLSLASHKVPATQAGCLSAT